MKVKKYEDGDLAYYVNRDANHFATLTAPVIGKADGFARFADQKAGVFCTAVSLDRGKLKIGEYRKL